MRRYLKEAPVLVGIAVLVLEINAWAGGPQRRLFPEARQMRDRQISQTSALVGRMAPNLQATEWIGAPVDLRDFRGKVVIVDFWAAWSSSSRQQLSSLRKLCERRGNQVVIVGVTNLDGQTIDRIHEFVRKNKGPDFVAIDQNSFIHRAYHVEQIPHTFIIDREGVVQFASVAADDAVLSAEIDRVIGSGNDTQ
jgi:cytochrome c biogenesis protein CcmG, thiol:disulfide interchange protein DsbE